MNPETRDELERQRVRKVRAAEKRTGYKEGGFVWKGQAVKVEVSFYPSEKWWIEPMGGERQELTDAIWAEVQELKLTDD